MGRTLPILVIAVLLPSYLLAQPTSISGVVNSYAEVTAINTGNNTVTLNDASAFSIGDRVLLIQMQGASINTTNTSAYGDITSYGYAGQYELNYVCDIDATTLTLERVMAHTYDPAGAVQLVRIPVYANAEVTGNVTPLDWNDSTGGIVALEVTGLLTLSANIGANGAGFGAAPLSNSSFSCAWWNQQTAYAYNPTTGSGAWKGKGIADYVSSAPGGKGKLANGGGGGNDHNAGAGGGGNYGSGGVGGTRSGEGAFGCHGLHPGIGGGALTYSNTENRVFLAGGGGAGHQNNAQAGAAGSGGGIVLIISGSIQANNYTISSRGDDAGHSQSDGASGGGAGGTVLLDIGSWGSTALNVDVSGGNGGNSSTGGDNHCMGPGGGGGGGVIWIDDASVPGILTADVAAGANGVCMSVTTTCPGYNNGSGATAGTSGGLIQELAIPENSTLYSSCQLLPVEFISFDARMDGEAVDLNWMVGSPPRFFNVERSASGLEFSPVAHVVAGQDLAYSAVDLEPRSGLNYYRIVAVQAGLHETYSSVRSVYVETDNYVSLKQMIVSAEQDLEVQAQLSALHDVRFRIVNSLGQLISHELHALSAGTSVTHIRTQGLAAGNYLLVVRSAHLSEVLPFVIY